MSHLLHLRIPLVYLLTYSLFITGLLTITTPQSQASNNSLTHSFPPSFKDSSDETAPPVETVDEATRARVGETLGKLPLSFEENRGQVDSEVKYISRGSGYTLFLTPTEAVLTLHRGDGEKAVATDAGARYSSVPARTRPLRASVLRMKLSGGNRSPAVTGESEVGVRTNYFIGNDPEKWHTDVARYERVRYSQVYPGIDMIYYGKQQQLEYDFEVAPGADPRQITLEFAGVKRVKIEHETGDLVLKTAGGEVRQHRPVAYQEAAGERQEIASRYVMQGKRKVGIEVGEYDRTQRLVIDPVLSYSTYLGGSASESSTGIAVDSSGHAYVTGSTNSTNFPTKNKYQTSQNSVYHSDVFVTKLDTNASGAASLLYSTYLGGRYSDSGYSIAVDSSGHAYVTGYTQSDDFPTHSGNPTGQGLFVTKLNTNLSGTASLLYSIYLDRCTGGVSIAVDSSGHAYVTGLAYNFFTTLNQYQTYQGGDDAFVIKLDTNVTSGSSLLYSTYLGGNRQDYSTGIAVDASGIAYVTGYTDSPNFPMKNPYQLNRRGYNDAFVTKLDTNASGAASLIYSTRLGGSTRDFGTGIAVDSSGHAYVTGYTNSTNFPTKNQYQTYQGLVDVFVTKLDTNTSGAASLLYSTYLGSSDFQDFSTGIAIDSSGHAYVTGYTYSANFPTFNQYQTAQGGDDAFVTKLDTNASGAASLLYSTYLGGSGDDIGLGIAADSSGNAYVTGMTASTNFPKFHQYQIDRAGGDAFVTKLTVAYSISGRITRTGTTTGINAVTLTLTSANPPGFPARTARTNSLGNYTFKNLPAGRNYTIKPAKTGFTFSPAKRSFINLRSDITAGASSNFAGTGP